MTATDRRMEIISILVVSGHATTQELAQELGVNAQKCTMFPSFRMAFPYTQNKGWAVGFSSWKAISRTITR